MVTGVIQAGSSLGILVPPSVVLVLYGMIARQPITQLWLAGVLPGLMMAALFVLYIVVRCRLQPHLGPALSAEERQVGWVERFRLLRAGVTPLFIFFSMTGLFLMGYTSLVESSAVGATAATIAALVKRRLTFRIVHVVAEKTLGVSCMFMWIIMAALCFGAVFDGLGAVKAIQSFFVGQLGLGPWEILIMMQLSYLIMGMFLDDTAMLVIVAPLYIPLVKVLDLGFENQLIWFGVLYTVTCQIAYITPPFGYNLFLMRSLAPKEITLIDIYRSIWPFAIIMILTIVLLMVFPQLALWLPEHMAVKG
jgi:tripartite ATP-independent transporter DctM subunit